MPPWEFHAQANGANASMIQNLKPMLFNQKFAKMSINTVQFPVLSKLVALIHLYVELGLPLPAALRAAEADLGSWSWHAEHRAYVHSAMAARRS
jgi:hypothetical protein